MKKRVAKKKTHVAKKKAKKKVAKKAIASKIHPSRAEARKQFYVLRGLYRKKLEELPEEKQQYAKPPYFLLPWNDLTEEKRERVVMDLKLKEENEPETQEDEEDERDFIRAFQRLGEIEAIEQAITIREDKKQLNELREEKSKLEKRLAKMEFHQPNGEEQKKRIGGSRKRPYTPRDALSRLMLTLAINIAKEKKGVITTTEMLALLKKHGATINKNNKEEIVSFTDETMKKRISVSNGAFGNRLTRIRNHIRVTYGLK